MPTQWQPSTMLQTVHVEVVPALDQMDTYDHDNPQYVECTLMGVNLDWYAKRAMKFRSYVLIEAHPALLATGRDDLYETREVPAGQMIVREGSVRGDDMRVLYVESRRRGDETFDDFGR